MNKTILNENETLKGEELKEVDRFKAAHFKPITRGYSEADLKHLKVATKGVLQLFNAVEKHQNIVESGVNKKRIKKQMKKIESKKTTDPSAECDNNNEDKTNPLWALFQENFLEKKNQ